MGDWPSARQFSFLLPFGRNRDLPRSRSGPAFILSGFVGDDPVHPALDELNMAVTKQDVTAFCPVIIVLVWIVSNGPRTFAVAVKDQPDLSGTDPLALQSKVAILVRVVLNCTFGLLDAGGGHR